MYLESNDSSRTLSQSLARSLADADPHSDEHGARSLTVMIISAQRK